MYLSAGLIQQPAYEFVMIYSPAGRFMTMKRYRDPSLDRVEIHALGETTGTNDGRGAPIREMKVVVASFPRVTELTETSSIRAAIMDNAMLNARSEFTLQDGRVRCVMDYPVKVCNVSHAAEQWQVDAGPVLVPDLLARHDDMMAGLRPGFIVFNDLNWADVVCRRASKDDATSQGSDYSKVFMVHGRNRLFRIDIG